MKKEILELIAGIELSLNQIKYKINSIPDETQSEPVQEKQSEPVQEKQSEPLQEKKPEPVYIAPDPNEERINSLKHIMSHTGCRHAVPTDLICNENSHEDKMDRARGIRDIFQANYDYQNKKILDLGTGYGHLVQAITEKDPNFVVGYDIKNEFQVSSSEKSLLTTSWDEVVKNSPYDLIFVYDVIDHIEKETPQDVLKKAKSVLADGGIIRMRCHPYICRHGGHVYTTINSAYAHLLFNEEELRLLGHDMRNFPTIKVTTPLRTYAKFISDAGLHNHTYNVISQPAEDVYLGGIYAERIKKNTNIKGMMIQQMGMEFVDYILTK